MSQQHQQSESEESTSESELSPASSSTFLARCGSAEPNKFTDGADGSRSARKNCMRAAGFIRFQMLVSELTDDHDVSVKMNPPQEALSTQ